MQTHTSSTDVYWPFLDKFSNHKSHFTICTFCLNQEKIWCKAGQSLYTHCMFIFNWFSLYFISIFKYNAEVWIDQLVLFHLLIYSTQAGNNPLTLYYQTIVDCQLWLDMIYKYYIICENYAKLNQFSNYRPA